MEYVHFIRGCMSKTAKHWVPVINRRKRHWTWRVVAVLLLGILLGAPNHALAGDRDAAQRSFHVFAGNWMKRLHEISLQNRQQAQPVKEGRGYSKTFIAYGPISEMAIKKTGSDATPFVGILKYPERNICKKILTREAVTQEQGEVIHEIEVTEIFRYSDGQWVY